MAAIPEPPDGTMVAVTTEGGEAADLVAWAVTAAGYGATGGDHPAGRICQRQRCRNARIMASHFGPGH